MASMNQQITSALDNHYTSSGLQKEFPGEANLIIKKHIEQLVDQLDNSIIVLSEGYKPWLRQLITAIDLNLGIKHRIGDEDTSIVGLLAGFVIGGGVAGLGGAFLGGIVGDLAGGLLGEPVEKLRKRVARRVNKKINQIEKHTAELFDALLPEVKQSLMNSSHYPWVEAPKPGAGQNLEIN
ncbi:hypothetical protein [Endozoicomonas sp. Mp262]|uniref:hypothetical protein n=1 Tax=Endozoicomonas sp. Mp262 TaxID=2919499 RepID=UPI0021D9C563